MQKCVACPTKNVSAEAMVPRNQHHTAVVGGAFVYVVVPCCFFCRLQHVIGDPAGDASPWSFQQLCRAAGAARATPDAASTNTMLSNLSSEDNALLAAYLIRTKRAVREAGCLKVLGGGGGGSSGQETALISETDKDLLRLRCTGDGCVVPSEDAAS